MKGLKTTSNHNHSVYVKNFNFCQGSRYIFCLQEKKIEVACIQSYNLGNGCSYPNTWKKQHKKWVNKEWTMDDKGQWNDLCHSPFAGTGIIIIILSVKYECIISYLFHLHDILKIICNVKINNIRNKKKDNLWHSCSSAIITCIKLY